MPDPINISEVVASFYSELTSVASDLNTVSDELGKSISEIDTALKMLNLGITVWMEFRGGHGEPDMGDETYWTDDIGYTKFGGRWGICLRHVEGDDSHDEYRQEIWLFNDAPRALRLAAIDHIVGLLQKLTEEGAATTRKIREKLADAQEVAEAVTQASRVRSTHLKKATTSGGKLYQPLVKMPLGGIS